MIALADYEPSKISEKSAEEIRNSFAKLCTNADFVKATSSGTNGKGAIRNRITMTKEAFGAHLKS